MNKLYLTVLSIVIALGIPSGLFAGNPTNAGDAGNVTGLVVCEDTENDDGPELAADEVSIAIASDGCSCEFDDCVDEELNCGESDACSVCLASLKRYGLTITAATAYHGFDTDDNEAEFLYHHVVEGNAGPFKDRYGGCPCDTVCP